MLDNYDLTRPGKVARTGFDAEWMTLPVATDPPLRSRTSRSKTVPAGTVNVHGHFHSNEPLRPCRYVNICMGHTDYRPLLLQAIVQLAGRTGRRTHGCGRIDDRAPPQNRRSGVNAPGPLWCRTSLLANAIRVPSSSATDATRAHG